MLLWVADSAHPDPSHPRRVPGMYITNSDVFDAAQQPHQLAVAHDGMDATAMHRGNHPGGLYALQKRADLTLRSKFIHHEYLYEPSPKWYAENGTSTMVSQQWQRPA